MEIYATGIPFQLSRFDLIRSLAEALHGPLFAGLSPALINFDVFLLKDKNRSHAHGGHGFITLPTAVIGERFLAAYGQRTPWRPPRLPTSVRFVQSKKYPDGRPEVVQQISSMPYVDPQAEEDRQKRVEELKGGRVYIRTLQFGWECRDGMFSVEWETDVMPPEDCVLSFDDERAGRSLSIVFRRGRSEYTLQTLLSQISCVYAGRTNSESAIVLSLKNPPTFYEAPIESDSETLDNFLNLINEINAKEPQRRRLSFLPFNDHHSVVPFTSIAVRVVCNSYADLSRFRSLARTAQLQHVYDDPYLIVRRGLFSAEAFDLLDRWLRRLHWVVSFQVLAIVYALLVDLTEALGIMGRIFALTQEDSPEFAAKAIRKLNDRLRNRKADDYPSPSFNLLDYFNDVIANQRAQNDIQLDRTTDANLCWMHHVTITPTTMYLEGPSPEQSNRVLRRFDRRYHPHFLRVSFLDEGGYKYRFDRNVDGSGFIRQRVGGFLLDGLTLARRKYEFLAYSQSALKEHCVWFIRPFVEASTGKLINTAEIINNLGTFGDKTRRCPALYAARISQAFTATDASVRVEADEVIPVPDVMTPDNKYCFTDGVGSISPELADAIVMAIRESKRKRRIKNPPRAFQIRLMGSKGMLSVDYKLQGRLILQRRSMIKFEGTESLVVEIARAFDKPGPYYLNRPLVMLLDGLGVPFETFKKYQDQAILETQRATTSLAGLGRLLEQHGLGTSFRLPSILLNVDKLHVNSLHDGAFHGELLNHTVNHVLRELKTRARIPIPGGWTLVGVADTHKYLKPNEIFACIKDTNRGVLYLQGPILISRSPVIHPGDVTIVTAIGAPPVGSPFAMERLPNTVVFSVQGTRPVPSCLGGGDLDGDLYNLIPLRDLPEFRPQFLYAPASYEPAKKKELDRYSTMVDVADFVMEYIVSDVLGMVATNWLTIADQTRSINFGNPNDADGILSEDCLTLAKLHSDAVDYPKSGQPVPINKIPLPRRNAPKPDWMRPETIGELGSDYYESQTILGRLFREIELPAEQERHRDPRRVGRRRNAQSATASNASDAGTEDDLASLFDDLGLDDDDDDTTVRGQSGLQTAIKHKVREYAQMTRPTAAEREFLEGLYLAYVDEFRSICNIHTLTFRPLTEAEVVTGTISQKTSVHKRRKELTAKMRDASEILVRYVKGQLMGDEDVPAEEALKRAWVAWELSLVKGNELGRHSFGLVCLLCMFEAMKEIDEMDRARAREMWY